MLGSNKLGQRITDMLLHDGSLYISTSSKAGWNPNDFNKPEIENPEEYGSVWRLSADNNISFAYPQPKTFEITVFKDRINLTDKDGQIIKSQPFDGFGVCGKVVVGNGFAGALPKHTEVVVMNRPPKCKR